MDKFTFYLLRKIWTLQLKSLFTDDKIWPQSDISLEGKSRS